MVIHIWNDQRCAPKKQTPEVSDEFLGFLLSITFFIQFVNPAKSRTHTLLFLSRQFLQP